MKIKPNTINILLFTILLTSILGSVIPGVQILGFNIFGFRIVLILLTAFWGYNLITRKVTIPLDGNLLKTFLAVIGLIIAYGSILYFQVESLSLFIKEIFYWLIASFILLNIVMFKPFLDYQTFRKYITTNIIITIIFISIFCVFEFLTAQHIKIDTSFVKMLLIDYPGREIPDPYFTFGNPNNLAFFLVVATSFVIIYNHEKSKFYQNLFLVSLTLFIALLTFSKLTIFSCIVLFAYLLLSKVNTILKNFIPHTLIILGVCGMIFLYFGVSVPTLNDYTGEEVEAKLAEQDSVIQAKDSLEVVESKESSSSIRKNLIKNSWEAAESSHFLGLGPGQFSHYLVSEKAEYDTQGIDQPHGFIFNVWANYGIFGMLVFTGLLVTWGIYIFKRVKTNYEKVGHFLFIAIVFINSNAPSSFIQLSYFWVILAFYILLFELMPSKSQYQESTSS